MYSLLLMTAMTTGGDAAAFGGRLFGGCHGCCGGVVSYSCYGSCTGSSCSGCCGGVAYGCCGGSCYGSCTGCWGSSCHGCCGGGRGVFGGLFHHKSCHGCSGWSCSGCCGGGCWGGGCCGGGCYGGCYGSGFGGPMYYHQGCYGSLVPYGTYYGGAAPVAAPVIMEPAPAPAPATTPAPMTPPAGDKDNKKSTANIIIELPANATLYVDGQPTGTTGALRNFHTPELPAGQAFYYEMKAEVVVGGQTVTEELRVVVHAGDELNKSFGKLIAAAAGAEKKVAAK